MSILEIPLTPMNPRLRIETQINEICSMRELIKETQTGETPERRLITELKEKLVRIRTNGLCVHFG